MNILSFDIEDWFHVLDNPMTKHPSSWVAFESRVDYGLNIILDLLDKHNVTATFFCLGWVAKKYPQLIKLISSKNHHIGSHSYNHQLVYELSHDQFKEDTINSVNILSDLTGKEINAYRAPGFSITQNNIWAIKSLIEMGFKYDSSIFPAPRSHGGFESINQKKPFIFSHEGLEIIEFPMTYKNIFKQKLAITGGGYFRLFPKSIINSYIRKESYNMVYLHPRDFDNKQPMIPGLNRIRKFKSYYGISGTKSKLESILVKHNWSSIIDNEENNLLNKMYKINL